MNELTVTYLGSIYSILGCQKPRCGDARRQQGEHAEPAGGRRLWGGRPALYGSLHRHSGGEARDWLPELVERSKALRVNAGTS